MISRCRCLSLSLILFFNPLLALAVEKPVAPIVVTKAELLKEVDNKWSLAPAQEGARLCCLKPGASLWDQLTAAKIEDLNIVHMPLTEALGALMEESGLSLNFIATGTNDPEVTVALKNTTAADALDLMIDSVGLTYELRGNTIVVLPPGTLGPLKTRAFPLSQSLLTRLIGAELAKAPPATTNNNNLESPALYQRSGAEAALKSFFEHLGIVWSEGCGMALADGQLIVTHNTRTLDRIASIVGHLARQRQVEIEARFMEISQGALDELGVQWNLSNNDGKKSIGTTLPLNSTATTDNSLRSLSQTFGSSPTSSSGVAVAPIIPGGLNVGANTTNTVDVTAGIISSWNLRGVLTALSQHDGTELLSAPRVTVLSGSTANIVVADELRYPQSYDRVNTDVGSGTSSGSILTAPTPLDFTTRNVGVEMQVTPYVEEDGSVTLILQPQVTQFERFVDYGGQSVVVNGVNTQTLPSGFFQPVFSVRRLTTEVNLPSGSTVLMGGLTREESVKVHDKVPVLGDIPLLGKAFRSDGSSTLKKNLVIFVTARLIE